MCRFRTIATAFLFISFMLSPAAGAAATPVQDDPLEGLTPYVNELIKKLPVVPGVAVVVVKDDRVIFSKGFGYRNLKAKLPVTPQTMFYLASSTKSFTATTARILADEGKIDLDVPLKTYLPTLTLPAPLSTEQLSLRDLLAMRSGIVNSAMGFRTAYSGQSDKEDMIKLLGTATTPGTPAFVYTNLGYIIAAYAMENATGEKWQDLIQKKVLDPLGMKNTTCYASKALANPDVALPYSIVDDVFVEVPYKQDNQMHAAGGMSASGEDIAKWVIMNMNKGVYQGKQIVSARSLEELHAPQIDQKVTFYKFKRYAWALGWDIADYEGDKMLHRFGGYPGFRPHVSFMPEHKLGVIVLTNTGNEGSQMTDVIASDIYDHLLRKKPFRVEGNPKVDEYLTALERNKTRRTEQAAARENARDKTSRPSADLKAYAGTYESPDYGRLTITVENNVLVVKYGSLSGTARYYQRDIFDVTFIPGNRDTFDFSVSPQKEVTKLNAVVMGDQITFRKVQ